MKKILNKIKYYLSQPLRIIMLINNYRIIVFSDALFIKLTYKIRFNKSIDLNNPKSFNEKLQWLKIHNRKDYYSLMVDKYEVKKIVSNMIGEKYIIPTIGIYNKFDEINFSKLPKRFVMKCTHDSGGIVICKNKANLNINKTRELLNKSLKINYYYSEREWPYKNVKPRIIIEDYLEDSITKELRDYKFFCFDGKVKLFKVDFNRQKNHRANYYDDKCNLLPFGEIVCPPDYKKNIILPTNIKKMMRLAEKLSKGQPFIRVDLYNVNENILFSEYTFYPAAGFGKFTDDFWDEKLGSYINIKNIVQR